MSTKTSEARGTAVLSDSLEGDPPFTVHGVALGVDDTTIGQSGIKKKWPAEALRDAASSLEGKPIVKNHENDDVDDAIGRVTSAQFEANVGVVFEGEVIERDIAEKIGHGILDVSPTIIHGNPEEMEENEEGAVVVDDVREFVNLSVVTHGAAPSNEVESGPSAVAAADLHRIFDYDEELSEPDTGDDEEKEELGQHSVHEPDFSGSTDSSWSAPDMEDFDTDDLSEIDDHFIVSKTGFPPDDFSDLALPVVEPGGSLNLSALQNAKARASQVGGLSGEDLSRAESIINRLAEENFDADFSEENEAGDDTDDDVVGEPLSDQLSIDIDSDAPVDDTPNFRF